MGAVVAVMFAAVVGGCASGGEVRPEGSPQSAAQADSAALLTAFRAPPGAKQLPGPPAGAPSSIGGPMVEPGPTDLVTRTDWWSLSGPPDAAVAWITAHPPVGTRAETSGGGDQELYAGFDRPATSVLATRTLGVTAVGFGGGTLLRVDAEVVWRPERPVGARVPSTVTRLVVLARLGVRLGVGASGVGNPLVPLTTVTDPAVVRRAAELVNGLPTPDPGMSSCGGGTGRSLHLEFYADGSSPVAVAVADSAVDGCLGVDLTVRGGPQHTALEGGTTDFDDKFLSLLGLRFPTR